MADSWLSLLKERRISLTHTLQSRDLAAAAPTADHPRQEALIHRAPKRLEPGLFV